MWTDVGGAWRSDDKGDRWYAMHRGFGVRTLVVDPDDADVVVQAEKEGLYRSADGGDTWAQLQTAPDGVATTGIWFHPNRPDTVLLAYHAPNDNFSRTGVAKSTDAGET